MKKIETLSINITNACNMGCAHCLRGDAKTVSYMDERFIPKIFNGIDSIGTVVLTGGEPSLYPGFVRAVADYIVESQTRVDGFFIVTNGKIYSQELVDSVKKVMFHYIKTNYQKKVGMSGEPGTINPMFLPSIIENDTSMFGIAVSIDKYHEDIPMDSYIRYYYSGVFNDSKITDFDEHFVLSMGRGKGLQDSYYRPAHNLYIRVEDGGCISCSEIYVTLEGNAKKGLQQADLFFIAHFGI